MVITSMLRQTIACRNLFEKILCSQRLSCTAGIKNWKPQVELDVEFPPKERNRLRMYEKVPSVPTGRMIRMKAPKMPKDLKYMRGPELVHTFLMHKQFGIMATGAGALKHTHIEAMRLYINRNIDEKRMFGIWRIEPPWKPVTKKGLGHRMGGGKKSIDHFISPVKKGRIVVEIGGYCEWEEIEPILRRVVMKLPFKAIPVNQKMMEEMQEKERAIKEDNLNPFTFEYCLKNNFLGSQKWASPYDYEWHNKYH